MSDRTVPALITLTTDFGLGSPYIAQMKGVILGLDRAATVEDLTHSIGPQNIREAAVVLCDTVRHFPPQTLHVCVVDPGVGTERAIVYAELGQQRFIAPDNGVLSLLAREEPQARRLITLSASEFWRRSVSRTFHGRDIMASVAGHLSQGVAPHQLGSPREALQELTWPTVIREQHALRGSILAVDSFGNLISNVSRSMLPAPPAASQLRVVIGEQIRARFVGTYGEAAAGCVVALFGSSDRLEVAVVNGHAASELKLGVGQALQVSWPPSAEI